YAYQMKKEYKEAIKWCENAIELGSDEALFQIGKIYENLKNYDMAIKWYEESAKKNNNKAMNNLGLIYNEKIIDLKKSETWYKQAIKNKNLIAFHNIAHLYYLELKDNVKASAYAIALIGNKYTERSVLNILQKEWKIPNETIKKGYELQLNSPDFPIKYKGDLNLE
ncbi:tetratricopeptide repeat protein, partial [Malaciobacter sp. WC5094]